MRNIEMKGDNGQAVFDGQTVTVTRKGLATTADGQPELVLKDDLP